MSISLKNLTEEAQRAVTCSTCPVSHTLGCFYRSASAATASQQRCRCGAGENTVNWALDGFIWGLWVCVCFLIACLAYMPACALTQFDLQCQRERNISSPNTGSLDSWNYTKKNIAAIAGEDSIFLYSFQERRLCSRRGGLIRTVALISLIRWRIITIRPLDWSLLNTGSVYPVKGSHLFPAVEHANWL